MPPELQRLEQEPAPVLERREDFVEPQQEPGEPEPGEPVVPAEFRLQKFPTTLLSSSARFASI